MPSEENKNAELETPSTINTIANPPSDTSPPPATPEPVMPSSLSPPVQPYTVPVAVSVEPPTQNSPGILVLQWLTYAFWGWLILALVWLVGVVLSNAVLDEPVTSIIPYAIASSVVLLPLAFITDLFYAKREPLKKTSGAAVIMIIHAVLFAIFGIIALIVTVFTSINFFLSIDDSSGSQSQLVAILTTSFAALLYAATFFRTLNPFKSKKPLFTYSIAMLSVTIVLLIFAIAGPVAKSISTRNDRLIEQNLPYVEQGITRYVRDNQKLPNSLNDISSLGPQATQLIQANLVQYKKETTKVDISNDYLEFRYQLCVDYTSASERNKYTSTSSYKQTGEDEYATYLSVYPHDAGTFCYKLAASSY